MDKRKTRTVAINASLADLVAKAAIERQIATSTSTTTMALVEEALRLELQRAKTVRADGKPVTTRPLFQPTDNVMDRPARRIALADDVANLVKEEAVQRQLENGCSVTMRQVTESALQTFLQLPDPQTMAP